MDECGSDENTGAEVLGVEDNAVGASAAGVAGYQRKTASCGDRKVSGNHQVEASGREAALDVYLLCSTPGSRSRQRRA